LAMVAGESSDGVGLGMVCGGWKDSAFNKPICILAFEIGDHLPLPCEIIVTHELSSNTVRKVIEEGGWRERDGGG
jgi:hypothetical protein